MQEVDLVVTQGKIIDTTNDVTVTCQPREESCHYDLEAYFWKQEKPSCDLFHVTNTKGQLINMDDQNYFVANHSLIYLEVKDKMLRCNQTVYTTDIRDIFLLERSLYFENNISPIEQRLPIREMSLDKEITSKDKSLQCHE